jgi:hypothetical protein
MMPKTHDADATAMVGLKSNNAPIGAITELLISAWVLSAEGDADLAIPSSHGILDRALMHAFEAGAFPTWARESIHFVDSRVGLQCVELPLILDWAQSAQLTTAPNPSYQTTQVQVNTWFASRILREYDVSPDEAHGWGEVLRRAIHEAIAQQENFRTPEVYV